MILITGATGSYGGATINYLIKKGVNANNISALVRDEGKASELKDKGVQLKKGDYDNYESLVSAFKGASKLLLVSGSDIANRSKQHENAIKAAKEAGVKHIVYTSFERKNETETSPIAFLAKSHIDTEKWIEESDLDYTILKNNLYMDFLPMFFGEKVLETGIFLPAGKGKAAFTLRNDMAEATANILIEDGHINKSYNFSNSENPSIQELADILGSITGKSIKYVSPDQETYKKVLTEAGVPADYIGVFAGFAEAINQGELENHAGDLEKVLRRKPTSASEFLNKVYNKS